MRFILELFERYYVGPRERRLGRPLTRIDRLLGGAILTSPLSLFVLYALVRGLLTGTLRW